jgi:hypothetical protein
MRSWRGDMRFQINERGSGEQPIEARDLMGSRPRLLP